MNMLVSWFKGIVKPNCKHRNIELISREELPAIIKKTYMCKDCGELIVGYDDIE